MAKKLKYANEEVVVSYAVKDDKGNKLSDAVAKANNSLQLPETAPTKTKLVGVGADKSQTIIDIGDGFTLEDGTLKVNSGNNKLYLHKLEGFLRNSRSGSNIGTIHGLKGYLTSSTKLNQYDNLYTTDYLKGFSGGYAILTSTEEKFMIADCSYDNITLISLKDMSKIMYYLAIDGLIDVVSEV